MKYKSESALYALNAYTWRLLKENLEWTTWKTLPRIVPTAQEPEIMESGEAFIVYGSATHPPTHLYELNKEVVSYIIYAPTTTEANNVASLLFETFERQDIAADDVNHWISIERQTPRKLSFGSIRSIMVEKAKPARSEGGYVAATVLIEMVYTLDKMNIKTRFNTP